VRAEEKKTEVKYTSSNHLCSLKLKRKAAKTLADNEAFLAAMRAKVNPNYEISTRVSSGYNKNIT
jgi:hypothetical protein